MKRMFFIHRVNGYSPKNKKCAEMNQWVNENYSQTMVTESLLPVVLEEIKAKVAELNAAYPRTMPLKLEYHIHSFNGYASCYIGNNTDDTTFTMKWDFIRHHRVIEQEGGEE